MKQVMPEEVSTGLMDWIRPVITGCAMPPRDPDDEDEDDEDDEEEKEEEDDEPAVVREPDED
jgi:hypothetical protein